MRNLGIMISVIEIFYPTMARRSIMIVVGEGKRRRSGLF